MTYEPVNYRTRDGTPRSIERDVEHATRIVDSYTEVLSSLFPGVRAEEVLIDRCVLEIGPGASLGTAVLLACHGARVTVADRYPPRWQPTYHDAFYRALLVHLRTTGRQVDPEPLWTILMRRAFPREVVEVLPCGIEDLAGEEDRFDFVFSTATLEHVGDLPRGLANLARLTRPGGVGIHLVDFQDHRDPSRPLEFLATDRAGFERMFAERCGECGNRVRPSSLRAELERTGLRITSFSPVRLAEDAYLRDIQPRLHPDYGREDSDDLRVLVARVVCEKPSAEKGDVRAADTIDTRNSRAFREQSRAHWQGIEDRYGRRLRLWRLWDEIALVARIRLVGNGLSARWRAVRYGRIDRLALRIRKRLAGRDLGARG